MFKENPDKKRIEKVLNTVGSSMYTKHHSRHLNASKCQEIGLNISYMEDNEVEQELILSIHHACMTMFNNDNVIKIFANQEGKFLDFRYA